MDKQKIKEYIQLCKESNKSPYLIAEAAQCTMGELLDFVQNDKELSTLYGNYINIYKAYLLQFALNDKQKDLYFVLLEDCGILSSANMGNDLELKLVIGNDKKLKIEDYSKNESKEN